MSKPEWSLRDTMGQMRSCAVHESKLAQCGKGPISLSYKSKLAIGPSILFWKLTNCQRECFSKFNCRLHKIMVLIENWKNIMPPTWKNSRPWGLSYSYCSYATLSTGINTWVFHNFCWTKKRSLGKTRLIWWYLGFADLSKYESE